MITGLAFYTMGYLGKRFFMKPVIPLSFICRFSIVVVMLVLYLIGNQMIDNNIIVYRTNYLSNSFWGFILTSISGTWLVTSIFYLINNSYSLYLLPIKKIVGIVFKFIAENGLVILAVHMWSFCLFNYIFFDYADADEYIYWRLCWVILITMTFIPIFNEYLYWMIGKEKRNK